MKITQLLFAALSLLSFSAAATAGSITWTDRDPNSTNGPLKYLYDPGNTQRDTYSSTFNLFDAGFRPGDFTIDSILVKFAFSDDADRVDGSSGGKDGFEYVDITVGTVKIWNDLEVDGDHDNAPDSYDWYSESVFGNADIFNDLNADGILNYSVTVQNMSGSKDTYLKITELTVTGNPKPRSSGNPVPDGGATLALLGVALMGLGAIRRKLF